MSELKIYKASAGSGKTFKLTEEYLNLVISKPDSYKNILAVTFTNKATAEMKHRIIGELSKLAKNENTVYLELLAKKTGLDKNVISTRAKNIIENILHDYSHFSVKTIESFFQNILQAFFKEIGLHNSLRIELNTKTVIENSITSFLEDLGNNKQVLDWITEFAFHKINEGYNWNIVKDINNLGNEIFKETFLQFDDKLLAVINDKVLLNKYLNNIKKIITNFENFLSKIATEAIGIIRHSGFEVTDFHQKEKGPAGYFLHLSKGIIKEPNSYVIIATESIEKWASKKHEYYNQIIDLAQEKLKPILNQIIDYYSNEIFRYNSAKIILKNIHTLGILNDISKKVEEYSRENSIFLLSHGTRLLQKIIGENDTPFIYEKAGQWFKHFMIDEFQDTSVMQWNNFKPLIVNSLSEGGFNLIVGDVKQSIYRWRNGDWQLLAEKLSKQLQNFGIDDKLALDTNWRSSKRIIEFNNFIFKNAPDILEEKLLSEINDKYYNTLKGKLLNAYKDSIQIIPENNRENRGYAEVNLYKEITKIDLNKEILKSLPHQINSLLLNNFDLKNIVVLVRKKNEANLITSYFQEHSNINVVSDEALFINSSPVIQFIVSCIIYINDASDEINKAKLNFDYLQYISFENKPEKNLQNITNSDFDEILPHYLNVKINEIKDFPLYEMVEKIIQIFKLNEIEGQQAYIFSFQDEISEYCKNHNPDRNAFISWWEEEGISQTLKFPDNLNAIRVMTIHKAKGLEFKAVLVPFCNWPIDHQPSPSPIIWCEAKDEPFNQLPIVPVKYQKNLANSIFCEDYFMEKTLAYIDNLNLLYVAFTRAKEALIINGIISKKENINSVSDLVNEILGNQEEINFQYYEIENDDFFIKKYVYGKLDKSIRLEDGDDSLEIHIDKGLSVDPFKRIVLKSSKKEILSESSDSELSPLDYGKLMHKIFERIIYPDDIEKAVKSVIAEGIILEKEENEYINKIKGYLSAENIIDWFSDKWNVMNETTILLPDGSLHRPDRVLTNKSETIIIDYKFSEDEKKQHKHQLDEYVNYLSVMNYKNISAYVWYVEKNHLVKV